MKAWQELTREDLDSLTKQYSAPKLAKMYGIHHNTVYCKLQTFGITRRNLYIDFYPSKDEIESLYKTMTIDQLATHYGVSRSSVKRKLVEYKTTPISAGQRLKGKKKTLEHRLNMSKSALASGVRSGEKNGNWKGGVSTSNKRARSKAAYLEWKTAVFSAYGWKCSVCGVKHGSICKCCGAINYLHAHHKTPFSENESLRYEPNNGIALCKKCHMKEHQK